MALLEPLALRPVLITLIGLNLKVNLPLKGERRFTLKKNDKGNLISTISLVKRDISMIFLYHLSGN